MTGILQLPQGHSAATTWRNVSAVRLEVRDVEVLAPVLIGSDAVMVTFENPAATTLRTLQLVKASTTAPLTLVTPGPPYADNDLRLVALELVDFMVGHEWEIRRFLGVADTEDGDTMFGVLQRWGLGTLCLSSQGHVGCTVYSEPMGGAFTVPASPTPYKESSQARDAFCAALAARLIETTTLDEGALLWATAAHSVAQQDYPVADSMPDRQRVQGYVDRTRFVVQPR